MLRPVAILCVWALLGGHAPSGLAGEVSPQEVAAKAVADVEMDIERAKARFDAEATQIAAEDQERLAEGLRRDFTQALGPVKQRFDEAHDIIDQQTGFWQPLKFAWLHLTQGEEATKRLFEENISQASEQAGVTLALEELGTVIEKRMVQQAFAAYRPYHDKLDAIAYEAIASRGLLGKLTPAVFEETATRIRIRREELTQAAGVVSANDLLRVPYYGLGALGVVLAAQIAGPLARHMGLSLGKNLFGKKLLAGLLGGPVGLLVATAASVFDIGAMRQQVVDAGQQVLTQSYAQTSERLLGHEHFTPMHEAIVAGLEQQLVLDRQATGDILESFAKDMLIQASSPGFGDFIAGRSVADGKNALKRVTAVFGRELADNAFWRKHQLVSDLEDEGAARAMVQRYGQAFVDLHQSNREALKSVMRNPRHPEMVGHILSEPDQADSLLFYARTLERFNGLSAAESEALILVRRLHPERSSESLQRDTLMLLGEVADRLRLVASQDEATAATVVDWVMSGQMDQGLLRRLARHNDATALLSLPVALGTEQFWKLLKAGDENSIVRFLRAFDRAKAVDLLRADPGYLAAFASAEGGGERAVRVRERLMQQYGPPLSPRTDAIMHWLLARTGVPEQRITKAAIERLAAFGIPGLWPAFLAVPAAGIVSRSELLLVTVLLAVMLLAGGVSLWHGKWRLLRGLWRRRSAARGETPVASAPREAGDEPPAPRYRSVQGGLELRR